MKTTLIEDLKGFRTPICEGLNAKLPNVEGLADYLAAKGYREASEVAREIFAEIKQEIKLALDSNYKARGKLLRKFPQEHNEIFMGSLNGKIDALRGIDDFIVELEKKYTEGEK